MKEIKFGNELNSDKTPENHFSSSVSPEIRISEVNQAINCWLLSKEPIAFYFPAYIKQQCVDRVFHTIFKLHGFNWIEGLIIQHNNDLDHFCKSIASYYELILNDNKNRISKDKLI